VDAETARFKLREGVLDMLLDAVSNREEVKVDVELLASAQGQPVQVAGSNYERARRVSEAARAFFGDWSKDPVKRGLLDCFAAGLVCT
jgi:hypothetical protein